MLNEARDWAVTLQSFYVQFSSVTSGASSGLTVLMGDLIGDVLSQLGSLGPRRATESGQMHTAHAIDACTIWATMCHVSNRSRVMARISPNWAGS